VYKLAHIGIAVQDLQRSQEFYNRVLGCPVIESKEMPGLTLLYLQLGDQTLELLQYAPDPVTERSTGHYDHIALAVTDINEEMQRLSALGIGFAADFPRITPWGQRIAFFTGPDGERIELVEELK